MLRTLLKLFVFASLALFLACLWLSDSLPPPGQLLPALHDEPRQQITRAQPFEASVSGVTYSLTPRYDYDITGLIVSRHDAGSWRDVTHKDWNDHLNVADLCIIWGHNARTGSYRHIKFWNGQFTCNWEASRAEDFAGFDQTAISNNHLLTDQPRLAAAIRSARPGDQIRLRGQLAEYRHNHGFPFHRGTSTTRTDTGNGACETLWVQDFQILAAGGSPWRTLQWPAGALLLLSLIAWFFQPVRFDK